MRNESTSLDAPLHAAHHDVLAPVGGGQAPPVAAEVNASDALDPSKLTSLNPIAIGSGRDEM